MNEELELSRDQLEAATTRASASTALDAEAAALGESFRAFGQTAERTAGEFDEAALIEQLQSTLLERSSLQVIACKSRGARSLWPLLLSGAIAASALIAAVRIAATWPTQPPQVVVSPSHQETEGPRALAPAIVKGSAPAEASVPEQAYLTWHDELDDEIIAAQSVLAGVAGKTTPLDGSLSSMDEQLEAMASDLSEGSL